MPPPNRRSWLSIFGPGILVAATGVGAGDLITASLAGSEVGVVILWAAVVGAVLKWTLNEGITRWQMATGTTVLEGWVTRFGGWIRWVFVGYFLIWSFAVAGALMNACGIAATGFYQIGTESTSKIVWGIIHSLVGLALVYYGGFKVFEKMMAVCIGLMFVSAVTTAWLVRPDWGQVLGGFTLSVPTGAWTWVVAVLGGVGGTVTLLSYGYWVAERGRTGSSGLRTSRLDLAAGYIMTALFGVAMLVIGSRITSTGKGARVALQLADQLALSLGEYGRWLFLIGFWAAVFSSLLGVWQSAPYLFADFRSLSRGEHVTTVPRTDLITTSDYRWYLVGISTLPLVLLWTTVKQIQIVYALLGSLFMPLLAITLLIMNNRRDWVGEEFRNGWIVNVILVATLVFFVVAAVMGVGD